MVDNRTSPDQFHPRTWSRCSSHLKMLVGGTVEAARPTGSTSVLIQDFSCNALRLGIAGKAQEVHAGHVDQRILPAFHEHHGAITNSFPYDYRTQCLFHRRAPSVLGGGGGGHCTAAECAGLHEARHPEPIIRYPESTINPKDNVIRTQRLRFPFIDELLLLRLGQRRRGRISSAITTANRDKQAVSR